MQTNLGMFATEPSKRVSKAKIPRLIKNAPLLVLFCLVLGFSVSFPLVRDGQSSI